MCLSEVFDCSSDLGFESETINPLLNIELNMKDKKTLKRVAAVVAILLLLCLFIGYFASGRKAPVAQQPAKLDYPSQWDKMGLPRLANSKMVWSDGSQSLAEGMQFELEVEGSASDIADQLDDELVGRDFDETGWSDSSNGFSSSYNSGNVDVNIDVSPGKSGNGKSRVRIRIGKTKEHRNPVPTSFASVKFD